MISKLLEKEQLLQWGRGLLARYGIQVAHFMPGRVRLKAQPLKGNPSLAQELTELFQVIKGVHAVEANHLTGSLLIAYNAKELQTPDSTRRLGEALGTLVPHLDQEKLLQMLRWL